jgi:hypothetical protein
MFVVGPASFSSFLAQDTRVMLDTLAVVFVVIHQVVHLPFVLVEPTGSAVADGAAAVDLVHAACLAL